MQDFYQDQGALFVKLAHDQNIPDFVKEGAFDEKYDVSHLPAQSFADPHRRLFPCSTPADTFVSAAYFHAQKNASAEQAVLPIAANLRKFARLHGIEAEVAQIAGVAERYREGGEETTKTAASKMVQWSITTEFGQYSGEDAASLEKAAAHFVKNAGNYDLQGLRFAAEGFVGHAKGQNVNLPLDVLRFAGETAPDGALARRAVQARGLMLRERHEREKVASASLEVDVDNLTKEDALKLAEWIERFDDERGLRFHYGRDLTDPMRSVFGDGSNVKQASDERTVQIGSRTVKVASFDEEIGKLALGQEFTRERLTTLTTGEAQALSQYL